MLCYIQLQKKNQNSQTVSKLCSYPVYRCSYTAFCVNPVVKRDNPEVGLFSPIVTYVCEVIPIQSCERVCGSKRPGRKDVKSKVEDEKWLCVDGLMMILGNAVPILIETWRRIHTNSSELFLQCIKKICFNLPSQQTLVHYC